MARKDLCSPTVCIRLALIAALRATAGLCRAVVPHPGRVDLQYLLHVHVSALGEAPKQLLGEAPKHSLQRECFAPVRSGASPAAAPSQRTPPPYAATIPARRGFILMCVAVVWSANLHTKLQEAWGQITAASRGPEPEYEL